jgi:hypothetical protein
MANENRLKATTSALAMLRQGWTLITPDNQFRIEVNSGNGRIAIYYEVSGLCVADYPLTPDGFEAMMNEVVNPPF